jgi:hypothetical protein
MQGIDLCTQIPPSGLRGLMIFYRICSWETIGYGTFGRNRRKRKQRRLLGRWHHQEVSALPDCGQDVNQWIERSFGDLVGH